MVWNEQEKKTKQKEKPQATDEWREELVKVKMSYVCECVTMHVWRSMHVCMYVLRTYIYS